MSVGYVRGAKVACALTSLSITAEYKLFCYLFNAAPVPSCSHFDKRARASVRREPL